MQRFIIEMGMGNDLYGADYTKAAMRAVEDAMRHSSLPMFEVLGISHDEMDVRVTIGAQDPEAVDCDAVRRHMPRGRVTVASTFGGMDVTHPDTGNQTIVVTAAVEAFLDPTLFEGSNLAQSPRS